ncbi:MAG: phosphoenolpyruvate--protein phosphotransferase [Acidobacteria bacterium]|nr:MAG: phosphoenolpyruvate--protein phosphotransferase [Acidobacteriota bacterium]
MSEVIQHAMETLQGLGVADGIGIGTAVCISTRVGDLYQIPLPEEGVGDEVERFRQAVEQAARELRGLRLKVGRNLGEELARIFDAQALFLADDAFLGRVEERIRSERVNAEWAVFETTREIQARFDALDAAHIRERSEDLRDISRHLLRCLRGLQLHQLTELQGDIVIVADDLTPSDAVRLGRANVVGFAIEHGGRTSHSTIIARSLNLPMVTGLEGIHRRLSERPEVPVIVDGTAGLVILYPEEEVLARYRRQQLDLERQALELVSAGKVSAITRDDVEVAVMANIDLPEEIDDGVRFGAAGVGLYRSEFLYIERSPELPTEEEHLAIYRRLLESAAPHPAIIRTYDLGGRKIAREVMATHEENPVLGLRGIRLTLARPEIFRTQLRALLRASVHGDLWIMLPLVSIVDEVRRFRACLDDVMAELEREGLPFRRDLKLGIMVEVPSAALISDILAREVDFFSIGTNDLIQYAMAVDRNNEHVTDLYQPLHPGMIRMLRMIVRNARRAGIAVSLCGEMAADERMTPVLLGCGLRRLSVAPRLVPAIKGRVRELSTRQLAPIVEHCADLPTAQEVEAYLQRAIGEG